jgi:hypothetical protein
MIAQGSGFPDYEFQESHNVAIDLSVADSAHNSTSPDGQYLLDPGLPFLGGKVYWKLQSRAKESSHALRSPVDRPLVWTCRDDIRSSLPQQIFP